MNESGKHHANISKMTDTKGNIASPQNQKVQQRSPGLWRAGWKWGFISYRFRISSVVTQMFSVHHGASCTPALRNITDSHSVMYVTRVSIKQWMFVVKNSK